MTTATQLATRFWDLQLALQHAASDLDSAIVADDSLARTLGDLGEFFSDEAYRFARKVRELALRLNRTLDA